MSRSDQRRALRAGRRRGSVGTGGRRRVPSTGVIDVDSIPDIPPCIDLTSTPEVHFVDLTSGKNRTPISPIVIRSSQSDDSGGRRRPKRGAGHARRSRTSGVEFLSDTGSDLEELPDLEEIQDMPTRGSTGDPAAQPVSAAGVEEGAAAASNVRTSILSPEMKSIACPVCMDNDKQIKRSGRRVMSTVCGHIFCDECIQASVRAQKRCPTCRKKLTNKQYHPIFL